MPRPRTTPFALMAVLAAGAPAGVPAAESPLEATAWVLAVLPGEVLPEGRPATLRFDGGRAHGNDGCNLFSAAYASTGAGLAISAPGAATAMACPPDRARLARLFMAALTGTKSHRVESGQLQLFDAEGRLLATFDSQPAAIAGTAWQAIGINNGREAVVSLVKDTAVTLEFGTDQHASGSAGCNRYAAAYRADGARLAFGPPAATGIQCARPVMEQEEAFLKALATVASARFDGDRLELRTAAGALAVRLTRVPRP